MIAAFIGHGASLSGGALGPLIDGCDLVVRLHDWHWQPEADFGRRYDYGVLPGPWLARALTQQRRSPLRGWLVYGWQPHHRQGLPEGATYIDCGPLHTRLRQLGARCRVGVPAPTRGLAALYMIATLPGVTEIRAFGCDAIEAGSAETYAYHPALGVTDHDTGRRHDMARERQALDWIAGTTGIHVRFVRPSCLEQAA